MPKLRENTKLTDSYNTILNEEASKRTVDTLKKTLANVKKLKVDNARLKKMLAEMSSDSDSSSEDEKPKKKTTKKKGQGIMDYLNQF